MSATAKNVNFRSESLEPATDAGSRILTVPGAGIEPAQPYDYRFLRPTRLPIPPPGQKRESNENSSVIKKLTLNHL